MRSPRVRLTVMPTILFAMCLLYPRGVWPAATRTVTNFGDSGAPGQLRTLMNAAAFGDTIIIPAGTITLTGASGENANVSGDLDINIDLTIQGAGAGITIIDGGGIDRVFEIPGARAVTMSGITIRNGNPGASIGGGIFSNGNLTLTNVTVSGNTASDGGGIRSAGTLTLTNVTVSGNTATRDGGGIINASGTFTNVTITGNTANRDGGGIGNAGTLTLTNSTISGNQAPTGGGILNRGTLTLVNTTISGNTASDEDGGGIRNEDTATLASSTISGNSARLGGGVANLGSLTLINVTISGNTAGNTLGGDGGGVLNESGGSATLTNVTISGNSAFFGGGISNSAGGTATLKNTIITNSPSGGNCNGTITSQGHNLSQDDSCLSSLTAPGDINSHSALLGPLQDNGGPTQTHALLPGSPAINAGDNSGCPPSDQRAVARPQGAACDRGAFEARLPFDLTVFLNQVVVGPGDTLQAGLGGLNVGPAFSADFYFGDIFPDGLTVAFVTTLAPPTFVVTRLDADPRTFPPLLANLLVSDGFVFRDATVLSLTVPGAGVPTGEHRFFAALTQPDAFKAGVFDPSRIIALDAEARFTLR